MCRISANKNIHCVKLFYPQRFALTLCLQLLAYKKVVCIWGGPQKPAIAPRPLKIYCAYIRKLHAEFLYAFTSYIHKKFTFFSSGC
jgi:hypothetical protein